MEVQVNQTVYKVVVKEMNQLACSDKVLGLCDVVNKVIYLEENYEPKEEVLIHELVHAFSSEYGFSNVDWNEELVADFISIYGFRILKKASQVMRSLENKGE